MALSLALSSGNRLPEAIQTDFSAPKLRVYGDLRFLYHNLMSAFVLKKCHKNNVLFLLSGNNLRIGGLGLLRFER